MKNLSLKERCLLIGVGLALFVAIAYIFVIMPLNTKIATKTQELNECIALDEQYQAIQNSNSALKDSIAVTEKNIIAIEKSIFPDNEVEIIENYIMNIFEEQGQKYLSSIKSEDVPTDTIYLPDGSASKEKLNIKRISVEYSSTDGYTIPESDMEPRWTLVDGGLNDELLAEAIAQMGNYDIVGYKEFISACEIISKAYPDCIRVHSLEVDDTSYGFLSLKAVIDVYSANLGSSRITPVTDPDQVKLAWEGKTNVDCSGGMIGMPLINMNPNSSSYLVSISLEELTDFVNRPFASYFSSAILTELAKGGIPLYDDYVNKVSNASKVYEYKADNSTTELVDLEPTE